MMTISELIDERADEAQRWAAAVRARKIIKFIGQTILVLATCLVLVSVAEKALEKAVHSNFSEVRF